MSVEVKLIIWGDTTKILDDICVLLDKHRSSGGTAQEIDEEENRTKAYTIKNYDGHIWQPCVKPIDSQRLNSLRWGR